MKYILERMPTTNRKVGGSNPSRRTNNNLFETIEPTYEKYYSEMNDIFYIFPLTAINIFLSFVNTIFKEGVLK